MNNLIVPQDSLQELEKKVEIGIAGFREAGKALEEIKGKKLYKVGYSTFEEYCRDRWKFTPQHANRLIKAAIVVEEIKSEPNGSDSVLPKTEAQTRALAKAKYLSVAWKGVQEATGEEQPSAKEIDAYLQEKDDTNTFDAEIIEDDTTEIEAGTNTAAFLTEMVDIPYKMGSKTGRPQVSVEVDDASVARLEQLKEHLHVHKATVVAQALLLMEKVLDLQEKSTPDPLS